MSPVEDRKQKQAARSDEQLVEGIRRSNEEDFTLLQVVPGDKDTVFAWYKKHFGKLGFKGDDPITVMGRTMVGFQGKDGQVSMTLSDQDEGKTFVSLVLSQR